MDNSTNQSTDNTDAVDNAVAAGGAYEVIRKRLVSQGQQLNDAVRSLNADRLQEFGSSDMEVLARVRVRTQNNCVARDIVQVGDLLLFGYNVFIGLKKETKIDDVFALFRIAGDAANPELEPVELGGTFLSQSSFANDFEELYRYYKHTKLIELTLKDGKLLAGFQIGERITDIRVFRWAVSADGKTVNYIDNRGERDIQLPPRYDFEWTETTREDSVHGRHPHVNVLDTVFVETTAGDLTVKIENNTEDGLGIYKEPVEDKTQSLDDADIHYAQVGSLILLKILPYREKDWRYLIYNTLTEKVKRVDAIGQSCVQLPEDHGIIFPGGYYLQSGETKRFEDDTPGLRFKRSIRSPNGEDVLFVFYEPESGSCGLFAYNLIEKQLQNPIYNHGYALFEDGRLVIFSEQVEPTRVHPMQIWQTPYESAEFASKAPASQTFLGRIGNAELVRGVSDLLSITRLIENQSVSLRLYEELNAAAKKIFDAHYWLEGDEVGAISGLLTEISSTAELVIDEFEKVQSIRAQSAKAMAEAEAEQEKLLRAIHPENWDTAEAFVDALGAIRKQRGHLITTREHRYIDVDRIDALDSQLLEAEDSLSEQTVQFLADEQALQPYNDKIADLNQNVSAAKTIAELTPLVDEVSNMAAGLDLLSELMATLKVDDATVRTRIIDDISAVYAKLNQCKAQAKHQQKELGSQEAVAQFAARFKLFSQSITNALGMATTPEKCDEQLSRLLVQLEELESQFSDYDQFLADIMSKRDEVYESFESHKQQLLDERQRKAQSVTDAAGRILKSIEKRSMKFIEADELNTYFASDALVLKVRELVERLRDLDSAINADDVDARFKAIKEQAVRSLRDKTEIFEDGGNIIKLGPRHKFSVNTQELDLTIIPREDQLNMHLTGTNYYEPIRHPALQDQQQFWDMALVSETPEVYRAEYLAAQIISASANNEDGLSEERLGQALLDENRLAELVSDYAAPRYKEGYQRGVHDHDAALLLKALLPAKSSADLLRFNPRSRALAQVFWANVQSIGEQSNSDSHSESSDALSVATWPERAQSANQMLQVLQNSRAIRLLEKEVAESIGNFIERHPIAVTQLDIDNAASYLVAELARDQLEFISSKYAEELVAELQRSMNDEAWRQFQGALKKMQGWPAQRWQLTEAWLQALVSEKQLQKLNNYVPEAVALINTDQRLVRRPSEADLELTVSGLMGEHSRIQQRQLQFSLDSFLERLYQHQHKTVPEYQSYLATRQQVITEKRDELRLDQFKPRPLSSFVRNRLINESYLPLIGDNLAKQMGTVGEDKRSDLMGLLMMISPPGYGKTTLMEYVASRLGLIFMKINCPSLGHHVLSLDPEQAPDATARQELYKLNLGLEMGNNVMLYLDDIQHTNPEFLQKFISLCDGTRRIDGVWQGQTKTYDMRGKKFCVVMAGNPYTESGEAFKIPDMLANRADIYNLGDILGGMDEQFALSYIENALTSNPITAPLAVRDMGDVYKLVDLAKGKNVATTDLSHQYSGAEINEITEVLRKMFVIQEVVLRVNQQYIASAAQNDAYRTEPAFKLQGSYRNMNKMTEKVSAVMTEAELMQMIEDHYLGEAQLLTTGAEDNLLKLAELRGNITEQELARWEEIKRDFQRNKAMGGGDADVGTRVVAQLADLVEGIGSLGEQAENAAKQSAEAAAKQSADNDALKQVENAARAAEQKANAIATELAEHRAQQAEAARSEKPELDIQAQVIEPIQASLSKLAAALQGNKPEVTVVNEPMPGIDKVLATLANTIESSLLPLVKSMNQKLELDAKNQGQLETALAEIKGLAAKMPAGGGGGYAAPSPMEDRDKWAYWD